MYCQDSHGSDIDHFWPKSVYSDKMFVWENMMLCCAECGRIKGIKFPRRGGRGLLVDPTRENPWKYIDFDPVTGNLTARFVAVRNAYSSKGKETVTVLHLDQREAIADGHKRDWRRLCSLVHRYLQNPNLTETEFVAELVDHDDHGLLGWCLTGAGSVEPPFSELRQLHPGVWRRLANVIA